jgi:hypothetical protein
MEGEMRRRKRLLVLLSVLATLGVVAPAAEAARTPVFLQVRGSAAIVDDGQAAEVRIRAGCTQGQTVLEAFLTLTPVGGGATEFGFFSLECDGRGHRLVVRVEAIEQPFVEGFAQVSGLVLLEQDDLSAQASRRVRLRA